jgi:FAD:protein FMN transferase
MGSVRAMACDVTVHVPSDRLSGSPDSDAMNALRAFRAVHRACTRFEPRSPLSRANARPERWHPVPSVLFEAVQEAHRAYEGTHGRFDPRVLDDLRHLGYDRSLPFESGSVVRQGRADNRRPRGRWRPRFRGGRRPELHLGGVPVDLGGIGKGLALRWARERLVGTVGTFLVDAGGDCVASGGGPEGDGWRVGVEDPTGGPDPLAVLELRDRAVATSSTRLRRWTFNGARIHHLIDPRTGRPGGDGLAAVTVVADDPAHAEVLTKSLFLCGRNGIAAEAERRSVAVLWVGADGKVVTSPRMDAYVIWKPA